MKNVLPFLVFVLFVFVFFKPLFLNGLLPIPSDTIVGLYYPYRDFYAPEYPRGIPFKNFLITDPIRQQIPWRTLVFDIEKQLQLPLWNPYSFAGTPLLANGQSGVFYPLNLLFFFFPFSFSWSVLIFSQPLLAGLFLYLYLRNMKLGRVSSVLGSLVFAFSGFSVAWMEWGTIVSTGLWLPLILLSIDRLFTKSTDSKYTQVRIQDSVLRLWCLVFILGMSCSFFSGHLQTFFYVFVISVGYSLLRFFQSEKSWNVLILLCLNFLLFGFITAVQWIPMFQLIGLSARNIDVTWQVPGWFIPWNQLIQFLVPDFFGNPATGNYWGVWNYGEMIGYVGIVPFVFGIFALFFRRDKKTAFFGTLFVLSLFFALPTVVSNLPFVFSVPFLSTAQPTRLLFVVDFSLAVLTGLGLDYFIRTKKKIIGILPVAFLLLVLFVWIILPSQHLVLSSVEIAKRNMVLPIVLLLICCFVLGISIFVKNKRGFYLLIWIAVVISFFDLFRFASKFEAFSFASYLYPSTPIISYLQSHAGVNRVMTTDDRILPPNFSGWYRLQTVDGYDPLYLLRYGQLIAASERGKPDDSPPFGFHRIITPHRFDSRIMNLLGVKYILAFDTIRMPDYIPVATEGGIRVYENTHSLPRLFFVNSIHSTSSQDDALHFLFDPANDLAKYAIVETPLLKNTSFVVGKVTHISYSSNTISFETVNAGNGFLVLTDSYYPTWHVRIDEQEEQIYRTDYDFRGIFIPKGKHRIVFWDALL